MIRMKVNIEWIEFSINKDKVKVKYEIENLNQSIEYLGPQ